MRASKEERDYRARLTDLVLDRFAGRTVDLCDVVVHCNGAYPTDVLSVLRNLSNRGRLKLKPLRGNVASNKPGTDRLGSMLPLPHPANYDWRFSSETRRFLRRLIGRLGNKREATVLLGAPSIYLTLLEARRKVLLLDRNHSTIAKLQVPRRRSMRAIQHDLFESFVTPERFGIALADPPWYPEFYRAFIDRSSELLRLNGVLILSMLPSLTRPSAESDRADIETYAAEAGFILVNKLTAKAQYESPNFEFKTLADAGIFCDKKWRVGDFFVFRKAKVTRRRIHHSLAKEPRWTTFHFDHFEIKLRQRRERARRKLRIVQLIHGGRTVGSVSRRDRIRSRIDLWTSENVAYSATRLEPIREALVRLDGRRSTEDVVREVAEMFDLDTVEKRELRKLLNALLLEFSATPK